MPNTKYSICILPAVTPQLFGPDSFIMNIPTQQDHARARSLKSDIVSLSPPALSTPTRLTYSTQIARLRRQAHQSGCPGAFGVFEIDEVKEDNVFVARAVMFPIVPDTGETVEASYVLAEGRSEQSRFGAVENLARNIGVEVKGV